MNANEISPDQKKMIGQRIKQVRVKEQLTMDEFGKKLPRTPTRSAVSRWESGKSLPNSERLSAIAEIGGISVDYLLTGVLDLDKLVDNYKNKQRHDLIASIDSILKDSMLQRPMLTNIVNSIFNLNDQSKNVDETTTLLYIWSKQLRNFTKIEAPTKLEIEGFKSLTLKLIDSLTEQNKSNKK